MGRKQRLSAKDIRKFVPELSKEKPVYRLACGDALYLMFTLAGARTWQHRVRLPDVNTWINLGEYGTVEGTIGLTEARERQAVAVMRLAAGERPSAIKFGMGAVISAVKDASAGLTFEDLAREWMDATAPDVVPEVRRHRETWFKGYLQEPLGARPIALLSQDELIAAAESPLKKSVSGRPARTVPQSLARMIVMIFDYARMKHRELKDCHTDLHLPRLVRKTPPVQHRACIVEPAELGELLRKFQNWYFECRHPQTGLALRMMPYVALRPGELLKGLWSEVDFNKSIWTVSAERMKMRRSHVVPLSYQAMAILNETKKFSKDSNFIFSSAYSKKCGHVSLNTPIVTLHRLGYDTGKDISPHGFRGTFSTMLHESGLFRSEVIELQLAHVDKNSVRAAYNHASYLEERREMMQTWADYLDALRDGSTQSLKEWAKSRPKAPDPFEDNE
ncbi:MAG: tyrosine-type recombinase/integrase [Desulfovibrio sp.]|nr:tyrosine-type recombinase/integrase [Desulfovibrio sp.]